MDLLEYQAKALFREVGIPVLPSQLIEEAREIKQLQVPYPIVLKSQVRAGGRGKAGGIRFVENTIDAIAAARAILNLPISGEYPQLLLAEARYRPEREIFLAATFDYALQRPVLLGSKCGGMEIEAVLAEMQKVVVDDDFSSFYARRLAVKMGLQGELVARVSAIVEKMYGLAMVKDLDSVEINPLAIAADGEIMALDGKVTANDRAAIFHPDLFDVSQLRGSENYRASIAPRHPLKWQDPEGSIGILCDGEGVAAAIWDLLGQFGQKPLACQTIGVAHHGKFFSEDRCKDAIVRGLERLLEEFDPTGIVIDMLWGERRMETLEAAIASVLDFASAAVPGGDERSERPTAALRRDRRVASRDRDVKSYKTPPKIAICLRGAEQEAIAAGKGQLPIYWTNDPEKAILALK